MFLKSTILLTIFFFATCCLAVENAITIPYDIQGGTAEGNSQDNLLPATPVTFQLIYNRNGVVNQDGSFELGLQNGDFVVGIQFRCDSSCGGAKPTGPLTVKEFTVSMSNTAKTTSTFSLSSLLSNRGSDSKVVLSVDQPIPTGFFPDKASNVAANSFPSECFDFTTPFLYKDGSLEMTISHNSFTGTTSSFNIDATRDVVSLNVVQLAASSFLSDLPTVTYTDNPDGLGNPQLFDYRSLSVQLCTINCPQWTCPGASQVVCYSTLLECTSDSSFTKGMTVAETNAHIFGYAAKACVDASSIHKAFRCPGERTCLDMFTCVDEEVPTIAPTTAKPTTPTPQVTGDPHFVGFDGSRYDFKGVDNQIFAIISDLDFQVNALFKAMTVKGVFGTWMTQIGFVAGNETILFHPTQGVLLNGMEIFTSNTVHRLFSLKDGVVQIKYGSWNVKAVIRKGAEGEYIDLFVQLTGVPVNPHGALGQTALYLVKDDFTFTQIEGSDQDYMLKDGIVGTNFKFSTFGSIPPASKASQTKRSFTVLRNAAIVA